MQRPIARCSRPAGRRGSGQGGCDMALTPNREVFITCALTGAGDTTGRSGKVPVTPEQIARAGVEAARAGAAVIHVHVRDPETGQPARGPALYREVVERVRDSGVDVVLNLTAGMGGDLTLGPADRPLPFSQAGTDLASAEERLAPRHRAPARDLHPRLRDDELRRGRLHHDQHPGDARGHGRSGARALGVRPEIRSLRHRSSRAREVAGGAGASSTSR